MNYVQEPQDRELGNQERDCVLALIRGSGDLSATWEANLGGARVKLGRPATALSLTYPASRTTHLDMRTSLPVRLLFGGSPPGPNEIVAWADGDFISAVEYLWYDDEEPGAWPDVQSFRVVPAVPLT